MRKPWFRKRLEKLIESDHQQDRADKSVEPHPKPDSRKSRRGEKKGEISDELVTDSADSKIADGKEPRLIIENFWWQFGQGAQSLGTSALAGIVVVASDFVEPGHMASWLVFGSIGLYFAGVLISFRIQRRAHRKRRAHLPLDVSGGGRFALIGAAIILCSAADPATDGLAGRLAVAALLLSSACDGAWIAIVATRQRIGFWRALRQLVVKEREAQSRLCTILIGRDRP